MASSNSLSQGPAAPSQDSSPQGQPQQLQAQQGAPLELAPLDNAHTDDGSVDDGLEAAVRQLQREQASKEPGGRSEPTPESPAGTTSEASDAAGETEGEDGAPSDPASKRPPVPTAAQWANLNRREQEFQRKQQEFAKERQEFEKREAAIKKGKTSTWEALKALGFENKKEFLERLAETGGEATPEQQEIYELKEWKAKQERELAERTKAEAEAKKAEEYNQSVAAWHQDIAQYVKGNDRWRDSLVSLQGHEAQVFQVIQDHYQKEGQQLPYDTALDQVNSAMEKQLTDSLQAIAGTARGRAIIQDLVNKSTPDAKRGKQLPAQPKGLTSSVRATPAPESPQDLSLDEALERNIAWIRSQQRSSQR